MNLNENDSLTPICQFLENQVTDTGYTLSGLSGSTTQNIETPNTLWMPSYFRKGLKQVMRTLLLLL